MLDTQRGAGLFGTPGTLHSNVGRLSEVLKVPIIKEKLIRFFFFLEGKRERKRGRKTSMCG